MPNIHCDVAIIGAGPAGTTLGSLLRKYKPTLDVQIFERDEFPREHVGESLLPIVCSVLNEMGCWDEVERANFPIKIGATYKWGLDDKLWDFEFLPLSEFKDEPRPGKFEGFRRQTAFQVERSIFDDILLDNAKQRGVKVHQPVKVAKVESTGNRVDGFLLDDGTQVTAKHYVDASGGAAILRRQLGIPVHQPTALQNVAFWDYWNNTEWAVNIGTGGTRVLVMSLPYGWIWFIPLGPTRTSIGLVVPAKHYKEMGMSPEQLYLQAISEEPKIRELTANATRDGQVRGTKDWSFVADRLSGENWFLTGECAGFADPILAAGITLAMTGARELCSTILELERGKEDAAWLRESYHETQKRRIGQHIQFADFWYGQNGCFTDLKEFTRTIAAQAGLELDANKAFQWLGTGGFTNDAEGVAGMAEFSVALIRQIATRLTASRSDWQVNQFNIFRLNLEGATLTHRPSYGNGRVSRVSTYVRDGREWPSEGIYGLLLRVLQRENQAVRILDEVVRETLAANPGADVQAQIESAVEFLEVLLHEGWVTGRFREGVPTIHAYTDDNEGSIHDNLDIQVPTSV